VEVCIGPPDSPVYCCSDACSSSLGSDFAGTNLALCCATTARITFSVQTTQNTNNFFMARIPYFWNDSSFSITFEGKVTEVLTLFASFPSGAYTLYGRITIGELQIPKVIRVVTLSDPDSSGNCIKLLDGKFIVTSVNISQRGGDVMRLELRLQAYAGP